MTPLPPIAMGATHTEHTAPRRQSQDIEAKGAAHTFPGLRLFSSDGELGYSVHRLAAVDIECLAGDVCGLIAA